MAAPGNAPAIETADRVLVIERVFDAPRELVFRCWTEVEHLVHWIGPAGFTNIVLAWADHPGETYRMHKRGPDGEEHWLQGVIREIVPLERIVQTFCWTDAAGRPNGPETLVTLTFADQGRSTLLTLRQELFESVTARDGHRYGWSSSLDQLTDYLAAL